MFLDLNSSFCVVRTFDEFIQCNRYALLTQSNYSCFVTTATFTLKAGLSPIMLTVHIPPAKSPLKVWLLSDIFTDIY